MANKKDQLVEDVHFIFQECARFQDALKAGGLKAIDRRDLGCVVPHPSGNGSLICGREAASRLRLLAAEAAAQTGISNRVRSEDIYSQVAQTLVQRFVSEKREVTIGQVERALATAGKRAARNIRALTHYVPCHLFYIEEPDEILLGPVRLQNRTSFRSRICPAVARHRVANRSASRKDHNYVLRRALRYYHPFKWYAEVSIVGCDPQTSERLAEQAAIAALNCLHLLFGAGYSDKMGVGGPAMTLDRRGTIALSDDGFWLSTSVSGKGQVNFGNGWSSVLERPDYQHLIGLFGIALEAAVDPDLKRPLSRRFLDAATWFGEAARETSPAASVVKYVTAIERMVMTEEHDDISTIIAERVAAVCSDPKVAGDRDRWRKDARAAYSLRSKLVHGSLSPHSDEVLRGVGLCSRVAEHALLNVLDGYASINLRLDDAPTRRLAAWFGKVLKWCDETHALAGA